MKIKDVIDDYYRIYKEKITYSDIEKSINSIKSLGGCSIIKDEYLCTVPVAFSEDINDIMAIAEEFGFVS